MVSMGALILDLVYSSHLEQSVDIQKLCVYLFSGLNECSHDSRVFSA
jgi:hypothetical protein